jgi:Mrp family chromosome partitioning ATPase
MMIAMAAVGLAVALPVALDRLDPRIRVPGDAEKALGFPPMGWIPERTNPQTTALAVDQRRRLALTLAREREKQGTKRITLVGVSRGAGTTTLTLELANELQRLGLRVLAVEANPLHPDRRFAGEDRSAGLGTVGTGRRALDDAIVRGAEGEADRLPLGDVPAGRLLAMLPAVAGVLDELGQRYDVVLIDAPPLLRSAEGEALVQLADGALLVVGATLASGGDVTRAARALERVAPPVVGVVVNRVRVEENARSFAGLLPERAAAGGLGGVLVRMLRG